MAEAPQHTQQHPRAVIWQIPRAMSYIASPWGLSSYIDLVPVTIHNHVKRVRMRRVSKKFGITAWSMLIALSCALASFVLLAASTDLPYFPTYLISINLSACALCWLDKRNAQASTTRMSERSLFIVAGLGGSIGLLVGMTMFRHKTRKARFHLTLLILLVLQLALMRFLAELS